MTRLVTADELIALDVEGRSKARRAARETPDVARVLRAFLKHGGPVPIDDIVGGLDGGAAETLRAALVRLDGDDVIRVRDGHIDVAYPFSAPPTAFVVRLPDRTERYACCAVDALGIAPMIVRRIEVHSRCHHCPARLEFGVTPDGPGPEARGITLWVGTRSEGQCKVADSL